MLLLPVGPRSVKIQYIIQHGIIEYGNINDYLSQMIRCYYQDDNNNKCLNAGTRLCGGRRRFIVELIEDQNHSRQINFFEMLRRLMWSDVAAADFILQIVLNNLNNV